MKNEKDKHNKRSGKKTYQKKDDEKTNYGKSSKPQSFKKRSKNKSVNEPPEYTKAFKKSKRKRSVENKKQGPESTLIRLNRYIANAGICSRREADKLIRGGLIKVNGEVVKEMGHKVEPTDKVEYKGRLLRREKLVYVLLNKPKGFITTTSDDKERKTVMSLVESACEERIYPVGRLDRDTTGLLLFTNDGELAKELSHRSGKTQKIYHSMLDKGITEADYNQIVNRELVLDDGPVDLDGINILSEDGREIGLELHSGRNRIVRRIFEHFGYEVVKLDRVVYGGLTKIDLPRGKWRYLSEKELVKVKFLKNRRG